MLLSVLLLHTRYSLGHYIGVLSCLVGLGALIYSDHLKEDVSSSSLNKNNVFGYLFGDLLCLLGSVFYSISNIGQELAMKNKKKSGVNTENYQILDENSTRNSKILDENSTGNSKILDENSTGNSKILDENSTKQSKNLEDSDSFWYRIAKKMEYLVLVSFFAQIFNGIQGFLIFGERFQLNKVLFGEKMITSTFPASFMKKIPRISQFLESSSRFGISFVVLQFLFGIFGFSAVMVLFYTLTPFFLEISSATFMNLSFLTTDVYAVLSNSLFFGDLPHPLYYVSFCFTIVGVSIFTLSGRRKPKQNKKKKKKKNQQDLLTQDLLTQDLLLLPQPPTIN